MIRKILITILLIVGIILIVFGWSLEKNGTTTTSIIVLISGVLLTAGMLGVMKDDLLDWLSDLIHGKRKHK